MLPEAPLLYDAYNRPLGAEATLRPSGAILVDGQQVADTVQCVHCGGHFVMRKGSGIERGWCRTCHGMICGRGCAACTPWQRKLDQIDGG